MTARRFEGRSVFVTGAASGIGRAAAKAFAAAGARVALADIDAEAGEALAAEIKTSGADAVFIACDASDEDAVRTSIAAACAAHGPIRHAFNNVGVPLGGRLEDMALAEWERALRLNLTTTFLAMKHEIPVMRAAGGGTIVNTASNSASVYTPHASIAYTAPKAGVLNLTHHGSIELGPDNIRVNSVSPGLTATPFVVANLPGHLHGEVTGAMQVIPRLAEPEEVAAAVLYLSADEAAMVTGTDIEVGGGRLF